MREKIPAFLCPYTGKQTLRFGFPVKHRLPPFRYRAAYSFAAPCSSAVLHRFGVFFIYVTFQIEKRPRKAIGKRREQRIGRRQGCFKPAAGSDNSAGNRIGGRYQCNRGCFRSGTVYAAGVNAEKRTPYRQRLCGFFWLGLQRGTGYLFRLLSGCIPADNGIIRQQGFQRTP